MHLCVATTIPWGAIQIHPLRLYFDQKSSNDSIIPQVNNGLPADDLPRLVCASGRTESAVARILNEMESKTVDVELVRLLHAIHDDDITGHVVRGFTLLGSYNRHCTKAYQALLQYEMFDGLMD